MHINGHWEAMNEMDGATPFLRQKDGDRSSPAHLGLREWFAAVVGGWVFSLLHPPTHHCSQNSVDIRYSHCIQRQGCTWLHRYCISNVLIIPHGCAKQKTSACLCAQHNWNKFVRNNWHQLKAFQFCLLKPYVSFPLRNKSTTTRCADICTTMRRTTLSYTIVQLCREKGHTYKTSSAKAENS